MAPPTLVRLRPRPSATVWHRLLVGNLVFTTGGGANLYKFNSGDVLTATFTEPISPTWDDVPVTVIVDRSGQTTVAINRFLAAAVQIDNGYIGPNKTATFATTTANPGSSITITLGSCGGPSNSCNALGQGVTQVEALTFPVTLTDVAGNPAATPPPTLTIGWF